MFQQNNLAKQTKKAIRELEKCCDKAQDEASEVAHAAGEKVREVYDNITQETRDAAKKVTKQIRSNPLMATAVATGVGFLVGLLSSRRK